MPGGAGGASGRAAQVAPMPGGIEEQGDREEQEALPCRVEQEVQPCRVALGVLEAGREVQEERAAGRVGRVVRSRRSCFFS